jgi:hypothetical protein
MLPRKIGKPGNDSIHSKMEFPGNFFLHTKNTLYVILRKFFEKCGDKSYV